MKDVIHSVVGALHKALDCKVSYLLQKGESEIKLLSYFGDTTSDVFSPFNCELFAVNGKSLPEKDTLFKTKSIKQFFLKEKIKDLFIDKISSPGNNKNGYYLILFSNKEKWFNVSRKKIVEPFSVLLSDILSRSNEEANYEITGTKKIEANLKAAYNNFTSVLYSAYVNESRLLFINDNVANILGYKAEEITDNRYSIFRKIASKDFSKFRKFIRELQKGLSSTVEYKFFDKYGEKHYLHNTGFPIFHNGKIIKIDGVITDITKEKKLEEELKKYEEKFRLLVETANDLIFTLNNYGYFVSVNNYGALALGYKPEEMTDRHFLEFVNENNKADVAIAFQNILKSDHVTAFEVVFIDKYGKDIVFEVQGRPTISNDEISGLLGIGRDITQRRKDEEKLKDLNSKLIEANRLISIERDRAKQQVSVLEEVNKLKSEFISNISHELRTPLASIVGFSETIASDPEMPKEMIMEFNNFIFSEGKRLAKLINDLLDFAKIEGGRIEIYKSNFDAAKLLHEIINNLYHSAMTKGITLTAEIPDTEVILYADKERITQVYQNLINNAIKFTDKGGRVTVIAQCFVKEFEVIVSDTGIGIPEKDLPNIFQKFYKVTRPGTQIPGIGLGLGLVKQIVDSHKGMITLQSKVNEGTTFIVKLPLK